MGLYTDNFNIQNHFFRKKFEKSINLINCNSSKKIYLQKNR